VPIGTTDNTKGQPASLAAARNETAGLRNEAVIALRSSAF
jgi:hypothetical protein